MKTNRRLGLATCLLIPALAVGLTACGPDNDDTTDGADKRSEATDTRSSDTAPDPTKGSDVPSEGATTGKNSTAGDTNDELPQAAPGEIIWGEDGDGMQTIPLNQNPMYGLGEWMVMDDNPNWDHLGKGIVVESKIDNVRREGDNVCFDTTSVFTSMGDQFDGTDHQFALMTDDITPVFQVLPVVSGAVVGNHGSIAVGPQGSPLTYVDMASHTIYGKNVCAPMAARQDMPDKVYITVSDRGITDRPGWVVDLD